MIPLADFAVRLFNTPLALDERAADTLAQVINGAIHAIAHARSIERREAAEPAPLPSFAGSLTDRVGKMFDDKSRTMFDRVDGVPLAVIGIEGSLVHKGPFAGYFGRTSYEFLNAANMRAAKAFRRGEIKGIVYEVDSFGGEVSGAFEAAEIMRSISAEIPTMAILTDHALSAGYLLASAARAIVIPATGQAGSIGVVTMHVDISKMLSDVGVKVTPLSAGKLKTQGNMFEPLDEAARASIVGKLEASRKIFADAVGRHRGTRLSAEQALETEAGYFGGREAVDTGLVDEVAHPSDALAEFARAIGR